MTQVERNPAQPPVTVTLIIMSRLYLYAHSPPRLAKGISSLGIVKRFSGPHRFLRGRLEIGRADQLHKSLKPDPTNTFSCASAQSCRSEVKGMIRDA